jgi:DNA-binding FadR family transcriptional regulator
MGNQQEPLKPIERISTTSQVAHRLLDYVKSSDLGPGSKLPPERQLATELAVARSALREALAALDLLGVVESRQGSGTYISDEPSELLPEAIEWGLMLGRQRTLDLAEARRHIEVDVAQLAAQRGSHEEIAALGDILSRMETARSDPDQVLEADVEFHLAIATMAKSSVLADILTSVRSLLRVWIRRGLTMESDPAADTLEEHRAVYTAIASRDEAAAREAMTRHMTSAYRRLVMSLHEESLLKEKN